MYIWLLFSLSPTAPKEEITAYVRNVKHILPEDFSPDAETLIRGNQILLVWTRESLQVRKKINPGIICSESGDGLICSGYAADGLLAPETKDNIFSLLTYDSDRFSLSRSPGGIGSYAFLPSRLDEAFCWSTQPPGYPTFVAKQYPHFCVAGNRPSLVCSASFLSHGLVLDRNYFHKYLSAGFAVDATTPYTNLLVVPPFKALLLKEGSYRYIDYPLGIPEAIPGDAPLENKARRLAELLVDAHWPASKLDCAHLALSGGKDSRIIAATLYAMGAKVYPYCAGTETEIAEDVAAAAHFFPVKHEHNYRDACPIRAAISCNRETDGLGIAHAHQFTFRYRHHERSGMPIFHGNGHLLRGGNARTMQGDAAYLQKRFMEMFSPWVTEETFSKEKIYLEKWRNERQEFFRDGRDLLFYMHHDFRIGMFAAPLNMHTSATAFFVYPFMDERISRYAAGLTVFDRVSERVAFGAVKLLAPQLADIGLFKEIWRFDRSPERKDFMDSDHNYQTGFEKRKPRSCSLHDDTFIIQDKIANGNLHGTMAEFILDSSFSCELRKFLARDAYDEISYRARRGANTQPSFYRNMDAVQRFRFDQFFCRAFIACSLYDTSWR